MPIAGFQSPAVLVHAEYPGLEVAAELLPCFILDRLRRWLVNPVDQPSRGRATNPRLRTGHAWVCVQRYLPALNHHNGPQCRSELTGALTTWVSADPGPGACVRRHRRARATRAGVSTSPGPSGSSRSQVVYSRTACLTRGPSTLLDAVAVVMSALTLRPVPAAR